MKRFLGIWFCVIALSGCDDGDLNVDTIDFTAVTAKSCTDNNLIFKLKESEALILNLPTTVFTTTPTPVGSPLELKINSENKVVYNFYNGNVAEGNVCDLIPPASPSVNKQLTASEGTIQITTTTIKTVDEKNNSTRISGYNHNIIFKNIKFIKSDGTFQLYETLAFGDYYKALDPKIPFNFISTGLKICSDKNNVYKFNESESLVLAIDPTLIVNEVTPIGSPRIGTIGLVNNKLTYSLFNGLVPTEYFCATTTPSLPTINQTWLGKAGGTIEVTTTTNGPKSFVHTIVFKNVTLEKAGSNFQLGDSYSFGELQTLVP
ncbi:hypothetical protein [Flavobacterium sp. IMCC34518]|uniref:hypothetical protein n=1 Tax=Flavobacterium sp. IMCC34518 TaxID=3003623 RepID=UPI0022ABF96B|nr:hypothetical protein [Flavobacterium sp. IMCC34518]